MIKIKGKLLDKDLIDRFVTEYVKMLEDNNCEFEDKYGFFSVDVNGVIQKINNLADVVSVVHKSETTQMILYLPCGQLTCEKLSVSYNGSRRIPGSVLNLLDRCMCDSKQMHEMIDRGELGPAKLISYETLPKSQYMETCIHVAISEFLTDNYNEARQKYEESSNEDRRRFCEQILYKATVNYLSHKNYLLSSEKPVFNSAGPDYIGVLTLKGSSRYFPEKNYTIYAHYHVNNNIKIAILDTSNDVMKYSNFQGTKPIKKETV